MTPGYVLLFLDKVIISNGPAGAFVLAKYLDRVLVKRLHQERLPVLISTAPGPPFWGPDQIGPNRIHLYITDAGKQVALLHHARTKPALPQMTAPALTKIHSAWISRSLSLTAINHLHIKVNIINGNCILSRF
jgi:hypothetical protein